MMQKPFNPVSLLAKVLPHVASIVVLILTVGFSRQAAQHDGEAFAATVQQSAPALVTEAAPLPATPGLVRAVAGNWDSACQALAAVKSDASRRVVQMEVTAYCPCRICCGAKAHGITASGKSVRYNKGRFVAADATIPFGTQLVVPGYHDGRPVEVVDRGGAIKGRRLDVFFPTHQQAAEWGRRSVAVTILP